MSAGYFDALGIELLGGRTFQQSDSLGGPPVALVDRAFVDEFAPGAKVIGRKVHIGPAGRPWAEIVGIVENVSHEALGGPAQPTVYQSFRQDDRAMLTMTFVLKTTEHPESLAESATSALQRLDANLPAFSVAPMESLVTRARSPQRILATLLGLFGLQTLILSAMGIYGVVSFAITRRSREIGIRLALGGARLGVLRMLVREGLRIGMVGSAAGLIAALALTPVLEAALFEVRPLDPEVFVGAAGFALLMVLLASVIPALGATKVNPMESINTD